MHTDTVSGKRIWNHELKTVLTDSILLLLTLLGAVSSFVSAYSIPPAAELFLCCAGLSLILTAIFAMPRRRWAAFLLLGGGYAIFLWQKWEEAMDGAFAVYTDIVNLLAERLHVTKSIELPARLTAEEWADARMLFLIAAAVLLSFLLGWVVIDRHSTCLTVVFTLLPLMPALLANVFPWWPAFMTLVACWLTLLLTSLLRGTSSVGLYRFIAIALPACAVLLAMLSVYMPQADYKHPAWATMTYMRLTELGSRMMSDWAANAAAPHVPLGTGVAAASSMTVDLTLAGPLRYTGNTVLRVTTETPGRVYLRGYTAARYNGTSWRQLGTEDYQSFSEMFGTDWRGVHQPAYFPFFTNTLSAPPYSMEIENIAAPRNCVYYPCQIIPGSGDGAVDHASFVQDIYLSPDGNARTHIFYYYPPDELLRGAELRVREATQSETAYRYFVYQNYCDIPSYFLADVEPWLQEAERLSQDYRPNVESIPELYRDRVATAWKVAYMLDATLEYDAETPAMPQGSDFVTHFLTESRRGYCMHFASAATLLLRSMGIPTRYVSGYAATMIEPGVFDIPDSAAHVWVEIYLDGYGWHPVEVTPAAREEPILQDNLGEPVPDSPAEPPQEEPADTLPPSEEEVVSPESPENEQTPIQSEETVNLRWLLYPAALAAAVAALALRRLYLRWQRQKKTHDADVNRSVLSAYGYLLRLQPWGLQKKQEVDELAQKARFSQHTLTQDEYTAVLDWLAAEEARIDQSLSVWKRLLFRYVFGLH